MRRTLTPELMDDPAIDPAEHARALRALARINRLSGSARILWGPIRAEAARAGHLSVLDIATGAGDVPLAIARRAATAGARLTLHACDVSETSLEQARARADRAGIALDAWRQDAVRQPLPRTFDIVVCSLFLHHLNEDDAVAFLRNAGAAADRLLLINDLRRCPAGLAAAWAGSRLITGSPIVHADAVKSVRAAYTAREALALADRAGLRGATARARWPWRMLISWRRT